MASGAKDWENQVNIIAQGLYRVTTRPSYGAADTIFHSDDVPGAATTLLFSVIGTGIVYGGFVNVAAAQSQKVNSIMLTIDGNNFRSGSFQFLNNSKLTPEYSTPLPLIKYDDVNFIYTLGVSQGFTFESSLELYYVNNTANIIFVDARINYALV